MRDLGHSIDHGLTRVGADIGVGMLTLGVTLGVSNVVAALISKK